VGLILFGAAGAVLASIFIKRTGRYKMLITVTTFAATGMLAVMVLQLLIVPLAGITMIIVAAVGFFVVPVVPISYQIGCELAFPIGEAQVTGLLNGGALVWAFLIDSILTAAIGFGTIARTVAFMMILITFLAVGSFLYFRTAILLKRKEFEDSSSPEQSRANTESSS
jgi:MFS family permease